MPLYLQIRIFCKVSFAILFRPTEMLEYYFWFSKRPICAKIVRILAAHTYGGRMRSLVQKAVSDRARAQKRLLMSDERTRLSAISRSRNSKA